MSEEAVVMLIEVDYLRSLGLSFGPTKILSGLSCLVCSLVAIELPKLNDKNTKANTLAIDKLLFLNI
jgi:hypothetical protein